MRRTLFRIGCLLAAVFALACERPAEETLRAPAPPSLTVVEDLRLICMVTDRYMGEPQIPTETGGAVYYGCCDKCAARLRAQPELRTAKDPVTGASVDKAKAVVARRVDGQVLYFESADTLGGFSH